MVPSPTALMTIGTVIGRLIAAWTRFIMGAIHQEKLNSITAVPRRRHKRPGIRAKMKSIPGITGIACHRNRATDRAREGNTLYGPNHGPTAWPP